MLTIFNSLVSDSIENFESMKQFFRTNLFVVSSRSLNTQRM